MFFSAFEVVPFCNCNLVFRLLEEASMPIFHASKLESPTSVSHGIQRFEIHVFFPQLASAKKKTSSPDWASTLKAWTRRMPLRVMAFLEAKKAAKNSGHDELCTTLHKISGKSPHKLLYICIKFDPPKIGHLITPAIM